MTLREAAEQLGITPDSLRQAIARGTLKASKRGRDWWVTRKQLEEWQSVPAFERRRRPKSYAATGRATDAMSQVRKP